MTNTSLNVVILGAAMNTTNGAYSAVLSTLSAWCIQINTNMSTLLKSHQSSSSPTIQTICNSLSTYKNKCVVSNCIIYFSQQYASSYFEYRIIISLGNILQNYEVLIYAKTNWPRTSVRGHSCSCSVLEN